MITGTCQQPDQKSLDSNRIPEKTYPFPAHDHGLNIYRPPPVITCPLPVLLHITPHPNLSQQSSKCPSCCWRGQLLRLELPSAVTQNKALLSLELLASLMTLIRICLAIVLAHPAISYAFHLCSPLGIPWKGGVDHGSMPGLTHSFPSKWL